MQGRRSASFSDFGGLFAGCGGFGGLHEALVVSAAEQAKTR